MRRSLGTATESLGPVTESLGLVERIVSGVGDLTASIPGILLGFAAPKK
jgi:hypothetical protein